MSDWTFVCCGCRLLAQAERKDVFTCSDACRVKAHRNGSAKALRSIAEAAEIHPASIQHAAAIDALCPELAQRIIARSLTIEDAQPEVNRAFVALAMRQARALQEAEVSHG